MKNRLTGFTLIEMIIVIVLISILLGTGIPLLTNLSKSFQFAIGRKDLSESAGAALRRMNREIRRLKNAKNAVTATSSTYRFIDIDNNDIQYSLSGTTLQRTINSSTSPLAENVTSLSFVYYGYNSDPEDDDTPITTPIVSPSSTDIYRIEINITMNNSGNTIYYTTQVRPLLNRHII